MNWFVLSATFRQSSTPTAEAREKDPFNKYLARGPVFRLTAEMVRDQALLAAGTLVEKVGGDSVQESARRRSIYTYRKRTAPPDNMLIFDAGSREICQPKRLNTNTPLQALVLLNNPGFVEAAKSLLEAAEAKRVLLQVGHVERFNPAFIATKDMIENPMFIETHRLAEFNPRGTDVPVVLDLMIHDIDAILSVVPSKVKLINASGVSVISETPDIANARIEFENGCVANLTASRISLKNMRKSRFFQKDAYISVDFLEKKCEVVKMKDAPEVPGDFDMILQNAEGVKKQIYFANPDVEQNNAILDELDSFADAINNNTTPVVTLEQGTNALRVAYRIIDCFNNLPSKSNDFLAFISFYSFY